MSNPINDSPAYAALLKHHEAKTKYTASVKRLETLADRTARHEKTVETFRAMAANEGQEWRQKLRENDGNLTKAIKDLRKQAVANTELADEYALIAEELKAEQEIARFETEDIRREYEKARLEALKLYAREKRLTAVINLLNTDVGQEFFRIFAMSGLIPSPESFYSDHKLPGASENNGAKIGNELLSLLTEVKAVISYVTAPNEAWDELELLPISKAEEFPEKEYRGSLILKHKRKAEVFADRQNVAN